MDGYVRQKLLVKEKNMVIEIGVKLMVTLIIFSLSMMLGMAAKGGK